MSGLAQPTLSETMITGYNCGNYPNHANQALLQEAIAAQAMDVEDLAKQGRAKGTCPYYAARAAAASADLVLMPYTTLLSQVWLCLACMGCLAREVPGAYGHAGKFMCNSHNPACASTAAT